MDNKIVTPTVNYNIRSKLRSASTVVSENDDENITLPKQLFPDNNSVEEDSLSDDCYIVKCVDGCSLDGKNIGKMARCAFCLQWFHLPCIKVKNLNDLSRQWNCPLCRLLRSNI